MDLTVAICTHNGAERVPHVLHALSRQVATGVDWEILVIDNASTDGTAEAAEDAWAGGVSLRVVREPTLGLTHARSRALHEARGELVGFVDDDNLPEEGWVATAVARMGAHPKAAVLGSLAIPDLEAQPPPWFQEIAPNLALGPQGEPGDVTWSRGYVYGAGMCVRRSAWLDLRGSGWRPRLEGRLGTSMSSGDDAELCYALRLAGWRIRYEPLMILRHVVPSSRWGRDALNRLAEGLGASAPILDVYARAHLRTLPPRTTLGWETLRALRWAVRELATAGVPATFRRRAAIAKARTLVLSGDELVSLQRSLRSAPWNVALRSRQL